MSIHWRLVVAFAVVLLIAIMATFAVLATFEAQLRETLALDQLHQTSELMQTFDRQLHQHLETLRAVLAAAPEVDALLAASNRSLADLGSDNEIASEMERRNARWVAAGTPSSLAAAVVQEPASARLRAYRALARERAGYDIYGEIFLTNRYGATVAATTRTSDYRQDDEAWWQQAVELGSYVGEVAMDESAGIEAVELALRIDDEGGHVVGVAKALLALPELERLAEEARRRYDLESLVVLLYDRDGRLVLAAGAEPGAPLDMPPTSLVRRRQGYVFTGGEPSRLLVQARSVGEQVFEVSGWSTVLQIDAAELLAPARRLRRVLLLVALAVGTLGMIGAWTTAGSISRPIEAAAALADRLARGELVADIEVGGHGEVARLTSAVGFMLSNVREAVGSMLGTSQRLSSISSQLVAVGQELASGAEEQSRATQDSSVAMEEMSASVREVARNAKQVAGSMQEASTGVEEMARAIGSVAQRSRELASGVEETMATIGEMLTSIEAVAANAAQAHEASQSAVSAAVDGGKVVQRTINGMSEIYDSMGAIADVIGRLDERSQRITEITSTIEEIAKRSHLLALNATVQAARAGEHGRGFAAVAEEVGRLAQRSAQAVSDIGSTLAEIKVEVEQALEASRTGSRHVESGVEMASTAGATLQKLAETTEELSLLMLEVRSAMDEQVSATSGMASTFERMRLLTSELEHATREQASSSESISRSIEQMHSMALGVSAATREQSRSTEQVAQTVTEIASIAAANAATARGIVASSVELESQATDLKQFSTFFDEGDTASA